MTIFINQSVELDNISKDKFNFNDADDYFVLATAGDVSQNFITFGNSADDSVEADSNVSWNWITFGNGADDFVGTASSNISWNWITFGDGGSDYERWRWHRPQLDHLRRRRRKLCDRLR